MANLFGFSLTCGFLGHYAKIHIESNTIFNWFHYMIEYSEEDNSLKVILELCKVQLYLAISSNIQDVFNFVSTSYFLRQDHDLMPDDEDDEMAKILEDIEE